MDSIQPAIAGKEGESNMKIVAIGGTGLIGARLVTKLSTLGHEAVAAAPNTGVNTLAVRTAGFDSNFSIVSF